MGKLLKSIAYYSLSVCVAVSHGATADQSAGARARLIQDIGNTSKNTTPLPQNNSSPKTEVEIPVGFKVFDTPAPIFGHGEQGSGEAETVNSESGTPKARVGGDRLVTVDGASPKGAGNPNKAEDPTTNKTQGGGSPITLPFRGTSVSAGGVKGTAEVLPYWWPICAFIDSSVGDPNKIFKEMIDEAAQLCQVQIILFPQIVNWNEVGNSASAVNSATREKCNFDRIGMQGSATALVPWGNTAAEMCGDPKNTGIAGCAELSSKTSDKVIKDMEKGGGGHGHNRASGSVAVSIEVPSGQNAGTVAHESIGHSQMGKPNGAKHGHGIGDSESEGGGGGSWTASGCAVMRQNAHANNPSEIEKFFGTAEKFEYDRSRRDYITKAPAELYSMRSSPPLMEKRKRVPPLGKVLARQSPPMVAPPSGGAATPPPVNSPAGPAIAQADKPTSGNSFGSTADRATVEKHKKRVPLPVAGVNIASVLSQPKSFSAPAAEPELSVQVPLSPQGGKIYSKGGRIEMAEGAAALSASFFSSGKSQGKESTADSIYSSPGPLASSGGRVGNSIQYNEGATQFAPGAGASTMGGPLGGGAGSGAFAMGAVGGTGGGVGGGGPKGKSNLSDDAFKGIGDSEKEEEDSMSRRRKPKGDRPGRSADRVKPLDGVYRLPASINAYGDPAL